jgi:ubiquinone/menaquinone biosynthesis C-methylase UbiE
MLRHAERRVRLKRLKNVELVEMDAHRIDDAFPAKSFDFVVASMILRVVKNPVRVLQNLKHVGTTDVSIHILNYLPSQNAFLARIEKTLDPLSRRFGWRCENQIEDAVESAGLHVVTSRRSSRFALFHEVHVCNGRVQ